MPSLVEVGPVVLEKVVYLYQSGHLPFKKGVALLFEDMQNLILYSQGCLVPRLVEIGPLVLEIIFKSRLFTRSLLFPFEKGHDPSFKIFRPFPGKGC